MSFFEAALSFFSKSDHPACASMPELMGTVDLSTEPSRPGDNDSQPEACRYLPEAFSSFNAIELARHLSDINVNLTWQEASREVVPYPMHGKNAYVQFVGPDAGFHSVEMRFGAFLMAPNAVYPVHSHASEELHIVVSGSGYWKLHDCQYELKQPGSIVHIQSWVPHAIKSDDKPLLMLWAHLGDIDFKKYRVEQSEVKEDGFPY